MSSPRRLLGRRSVHEILGGGAVADVILWRRRNASIGILLGTLAFWILFEKSGYTPLSFASSVMLLLVCILFVWSKAAAILNRPPPPLPELDLTKAALDEASVLIHGYATAVLSAWHDISLGKDSKLFFKVAASLWLISVVGSWTDIFTLGYTSLIIILTIPALCERFKDYIEHHVIMFFGEVRRVHGYSIGCRKTVRRWLLDKRELLSKTKKLS